jgi:transposase
MEGSKSRMQGKDTTDKIEVYVGIDVSKSRLEVAVVAAAGAGAEEEAWRVANSAAGVADLVRRLGRFTVLRAALEPTGRMHLAAWTALAETGIAVVVLNPYRARSFAQANGWLAKTDAIDARMLARAAARLEAAGSPPPSPERRRLRELQALRRNLVTRRGALANQLAATTDRLARRLLATESAMVRRYIARLEAESRGIVEADPALARRFAILVSVPGLGPVSALALIADLPELGHASDKEIAALLGVAPMNRDSGAWRGQRRIKGGRGPLRATLTMAALAASRANPALAVFRARLREAGKPHRVVMTAVLRKLIVMANALVRDGRTWNPEPA